MRFAADGRVFVTEKSGAIKIFDNLSDPTPTVFTDLQPRVHNFWDRGLLGMALDPSLTGGTGNGSYVYVLYSYDHILGSPDAAPRWGDTCPSPPGATTDGCVISGRLSRFAVTGSTVTGSEQVLIEDWCQQFPSHSIGSLAFGPDGALYASAGDGANFNGVDYGQRGGTLGDPVVTPANPCGDPPGGTLTPPTAEGGALRSQSVRGANFTHASLDGSILRVDPNTGAGKAGNPFASSSDANARRILAYGLRNPFRMTFRPGSNELYLGDVGWFDWEEINRISNVTDGAARNFGWPCYEGAFHLGGYDGTNLNLCESLYAKGAAGATDAMYIYGHEEAVDPNDNCGLANGSSTTGLAFYPTSGGSFPAAYRGGLFFADHSRNCIWFMPTAANGQPDVAARRIFLDGAANPVDLTVGPGGDLFYVDFDGGTIRRIAPNDSPIAAFSADTTIGSLPLDVHFDASASSDPNGGAISYAWDLDGDGQYDDGTGVTASWTYTVAGDVVVGLQVTAGGRIDTASDVINAGNDLPVPVITTPSSSLRWKVGDVVSFSGSATDAQDGVLPPSALSWTLILQHCPSACHAHAIQSFDGVTSGSFNAPDHEYPSYLELKLTAKDSQGKAASTTLRLDPRTVALTFATSPTGLSLAVNNSSSVAPIVRTVIVGSSNSVTATSPQVKSGLTYIWSAWSDHLARSHEVIAPATNTTFTATYKTSSLRFLASADAYVAAAKPNSNFGGSTVLKVRDKVYRSFVKFSVTGLSRRPSSAKLRLWVTNPSTSSGSVYLVSSSWSQSTITWNNAPKIGGAASLANLGLTTTGTWVEVSVTSAISGNGTFSFRLSAGNTNEADFASRETTHDPVLIITP